MQVETDPEPSDVGRDRAQRRLLVDPQLLEEAGHVPAHQRFQQRAVVLGAGPSHQLLHQVLHVVVVFDGLHAVQQELAGLHQRRLREAQSKAVADAQFEKNNFNETHISLTPMRMPASESTKRRTSLVLVAFVASLLVGFGTIVLAHNIATRKN